MNVEIMQALRNTRRNHRSGWKTKPHQPREEKK